jgi:hypothetical protein
VRIEVLPPVRTRGIPSTARETLLDDVREKIAERYRLTSDGPPAVDDPALMSALLGYNTRRETRSI